MYDVTKPDELQVLVDRVIFENDLDNKDHSAIAGKICEITGKEVAVDTIAELMTMDVFEDDMRLITKHVGVTC